MEPEHASSSRRPPLAPVVRSEAESEEDSDHDAADVSERSQASARSTGSRGDPSGRLSPRSARMSAAMMGHAGRVSGSGTGRTAESEAFSPAFLSPRMWNEEDMLLPPSSEVPSRPVVTGRESQDKGCFGLYTFVMVLFLFQGTAAIFGANYQMPHEFALCRSRLEQVGCVRGGREGRLCGGALARRMLRARARSRRMVCSDVSLPQESVKAARVVPAAEIKQHNLEVAGGSAEERASPRGAHILADITGHPYLPYQPHGHRAHVAVAAQAKETMEWDGGLHTSRGVRRLLAAEAAGASVRDPVAMAASAAVGAAAVDGSRLDSEIESNIRSVGKVLSEMQNLTSVVMVGGNGANASSSSVILALDGNATDAGSETQDSEEESVPYQDPFQGGEEAEKTLVATYRRVGNASSIVALLALSSVIFGAVRDTIDTRHCGAQVSE